MLDLQILAISTLRIDHSTLWQFAGREGRFTPRLQLRRFGFDCYVCLTRWYSALPDLRIPAPDTVL